MKTALQELIAHLEYRKDASIEATRALDFIKRNKLLEKEKHQTITAFTDGQIDIINCFCEKMPEIKTLVEAVKNIKEDNEDGIEYFNNTYNQ